jgi:CheY-like chemotaxis protein
MADILVIDDSDDIREGICEVLRSVGHTVAEAADGRKAIAILDTRRFDVVVTDILMPEQDGTEVIMHLLGQPDRPRVLAMSGGGANMPAYMSLHLARLKADATLMKPFTNDELQSRIEQLLAVR